MLTPNQLVSYESLIPWDRVRLGWEALSGQRTALGAEARAEWLEWLSAIADSENGKITAADEAKFWRDVATAMDAQDDRRGTMMTFK